MIRLVLNTEVPPDGSIRTWRLPLAARIASSLPLLLICMVVPALGLQMTLLDNAAPGPKWWIAFVVFVAAWGLLTWRIATQYVTLTPDRLVIRNVLGTQAVLLTNIAWLGFRQGRLIINAAPGYPPPGAPATIPHPASRAHPVGAAHPAAQLRVPVNVANLGSSYWSGLRGRADEIADTIAAAAGLPALPPRRKLIPRPLALAMLPTGAALAAVGTYSNPGWGAKMKPPILLAVATGPLLPVGVIALAIGLAVTLDYWRKRRPSAA